MFKSIYLRYPHTTNYRPVRVCDRKYEEVEHVEEASVLRIGDQLVHDVRDSGGADPLSRVNTWHCIA